MIETGIQYLDIEMFRKYCGTVKIILCIEVPMLMEKILSHLKDKTLLAEAARAPDAAASQHIRLTLVIHHPSAYVATPQEEVAGFCGNSGVNDCPVPINYLCTLVKKAFILLYLRPSAL